MGVAAYRHGAIAWLAADAAVHDLGHVGCLHWVIGRLGNHIANRSGPAFAAGQSVPPDGQGKGAHDRA
jgi:hypothetical protein